MAILLIFLWKNLKRVQFHWLSTLISFGLPIALALVTFILASNPVDYSRPEINTDVSLFLLHNIVPYNHRLNSIEIL